MAKAGKKSLGLNSQGPIHPRVYAIATELNNRLKIVEKKTGNRANLAALTALDMRWITEFLATGDPYKATDVAYCNSKMTPSSRVSMAIAKQEKPMIQRVIGEIMSTDEKFSDEKIMDKAAELYYDPESESTSVQMFGHLAKIKGWNAPEKGINVNINKNIGDSTNEEFLETLDTLITREEGPFQGQSNGDNEERTELADDLTT